MQKNSLPLHVAVIIDGNRRWAKARGKLPWEGHAEGAKRVEEISKEAVDLGIKYTTFWGGSYNNLTKRTRKEIKFLDEKMYRVWANKALKDKEVKEKQIRIRFIGEWPDLLSAETVKAMREVEKTTQKHSRHHLTYLIGYNGDREMLSTIRGIVKDKPRRVDEKTIKSHLWTRELPPVDLVIRTGEDARNAHMSTGFMMWDTKDALLHFSPKMWPAFTKSDFRQVVRDFSSRERRFGK
ncbi:MAG: polyprenyl diphosphate synthase [bacterium]|nr:polyprenyl diphosphate synthase [bacterium]